MLFRSPSAPSGHVRAAEGDIGLLRLHQSKLAAQVLPKGHWKDNDRMAQRICLRRITAISTVGPSRRNEMTHPARSRTKPDWRALLRQRRHQAARRNRLLPLLLSLWLNTKGRHFRRRHRKGDAFHLRKPVLPHLQEALRLYNPPRPGFLTTRHSRAATPETRRAERNVVRQSTPAIFPARYEPK